MIRIRGDWDLSRLQVNDLEGGTNDVENEVLVGSNPLLVGHDDGVLRYGQ